MMPAPDVDDRKLMTGLAAGAVVIATLVYLPVLERMVLHWQVDADYSHGFLVAPLAIYFAWERRRDLARARIEGSWWGVLLLAAGVLSMSIGQLGGLLTMLRSGFVLTVMGLVLLLLGREIFRILLFPLLFLFLMVPLPRSLVNVVAFPLQLSAAQWAVSSLQTMGVPALVEGNIIHLAHTQLFVAEACSGLRSLMALVTLGVVFAHFFKRGHRVQQAVLVASTIPIAVVVNAARVTLTGWLAHTYGEHSAQGVIHEFQGIITFSLAFFALMGVARLLDAGELLARRLRPQTEAR
jgi:exosortase